MPCCCPPGEAGEILPDTPQQKLLHKARYRRALGLILAGEYKRAKADHAELRRVRFYRLGWQDLVLRADKLDGSNAPLKEVAAKPLVAASDPKVLVSVISPTTVERHGFHERVLYASFNAQKHPHKELIVVDSGGVPSPFFTDLDDRRVRYIHKASANSVGAKRNVALRLAEGKVVAHFDDDDLYAPTYLTTMLAAMRESQTRFIKLNSWYVHCRTTGRFGFFDGDKGFDGDRPAKLRLHPDLAKFKDNYVRTYGFSYVYEKAITDKFAFHDKSWGEDTALLAAAVGTKVPCAMVPDRDGVCLHIQHGDNCSISLCHRAVDGDRFERPHSADAAPVAKLLDAAQDCLAAVPVPDEAVGGMFVWEHELRQRRFDADATLAAFVAWLKGGGGFNASRYRKLGLDLPSGRDADAGKPDLLGANSTDLERAVDLGINTLRGTARVTPSWAKAMQQQDPDAAAQ